MKFYPTDFEVDTRILNPFELGCYIRLLCRIWIDGKEGTIECSMDQISRIFGAALQSSYSTLTNLWNLNILTIIPDDPSFVGMKEIDPEATFTIKSRRIEKDILDLKTNAKYQERHREKSKEKVREMSGESKGEVRDRCQMSDVRSQKKKNGPSIPFSKELLDHVVQTWEAKRKNKYPLHGGKHMAILKNAAKIYQPWGVMALWDIYLDTSDDFYRRAGYSIEMFSTQLTRLVDNSGWKLRAEKYEQALNGGPAPDLTALLDKIGNKKVPA